MGSTVLNHDELARTFARRGVVNAYRHRPPYPAEVFDILDGLATDRPRRILDIGCGEGALARPLAERADFVHAVDVSEAMVDLGRRRPGGDRENLLWTVGGAETCALEGPYALVTAGASLHWMDRGALMPRLAAAMGPHASLAIVEHGATRQPWREELNRVVGRHSRHRDYDPRYSLVDDLVGTGHFAVAGRAETTPVEFIQSVDDYVESLHSTASLAREHMPASEAEEFDAAIADAVRPFARDGHVALRVVAKVTWGRPRG